MRNLNIGIFCLLFVFFTACNKEDIKDVLPAGSISFRYTADKDTIDVPLSILKDSTVIFGMNAALSGHISGSEHWVQFGVDTTKIIDYRAKYGNALLLPATSYLFYKSMVRLRAGDVISDSAILNIGLQTRLTEYSTYVLPIVIKSVDGAVEGKATSRVVYYVFRTGKPAVISKTGWTLPAYSSQNNATTSADKVLDLNNTTTYWASSTQQSMPQWLTINFNRDITFSAVNYYFPTALNYPTSGGYPTSIVIETSMNGTTWVNKGTFVGAITNNMQTLNTGITTARYLRFTVNEAVKYSTFNIVFISGIALVP